MKSTYGTLFGVEYQRGTGAVRLIYCSLVASTIALIRIICDLALGFAIVHHHAWSLLCASLLDLVLNFVAVAGARYALAQRSRGVTVFAVASFLETALFSLVYFAVVVIEVMHAWAYCEPMSERCDQRESELSQHGASS
ncbi:unnamed protein product [Effrenium voratum]|nr:unnamed protein product [Effrenium voratum]